jgi:hypothetical protein
MRFVELTGIAVILWAGIIVSAAAFAAGLAVTGLCALAALAASIAYTLSLLFQG